MLLVTKVTNSFLTNFPWFFCKYLCMYFKNYLIFHTWIIRDNVHYPITLTCLYRKNVNRHHINTNLYTIHVSLAMKDSLSYLLFFICWYTADEPRQAMNRITFHISTTLFIAFFHQPSDFLISFCERLIVSPH